jgi:phospholipase/lecithinase/hemolysin
MAGHAAFAAFSQIIVFGDSSVDAGYYRALASPGSTTAYNAD